MGAPHNAIVCIHFDNRISPFRNQFLTVTEFGASASVGLGYPEAYTAASHPVEPLAPQIYTWKTVSTRGASRQIL